MFNCVVFYSTVKIMASELYVEKFGGESIITNFFESKKNSNCILDLEEMLLSNDENCVLSGIGVVGRLFTQVFDREMLCESLDKDEDEEKYREWLLSRYNDFISHLLSFLSNDSEEIQETALRTLMLFVQLEGGKPLKSVKNDVWFFPKHLFQKVISELASLFDNKYNLITKFQEYALYDDIKMYLLKAILNTFQQAEEVTDMFLQNCFSLLCSFKYPKEFSNVGEIINDNSNIFLTQGCQKSFCLKEKLFCKLFSSTWMQFLKYELPPSLFNKTLLVLHKRVIPYLHNPCLLTDFLTDAYNKGGVTSLLALSGLFLLMQKYNVEYPDFFFKLYALFEESIINGKFSSRFFYLSDLFLSSTHLPSHIVASFIKKLSRISLLSRTDTVIKVITLVCNLLIRHPTLSVLIHRTDPTDLERDPYDFSAVDPAESKAMDSSLWEIKTLQFHANPEVSRKAKMINRELPKLELDLVSVIDMSMDSIYKKERKRKFSEVPLAINKPSEHKDWWILSNKYI